MSVGKRHESVFLVFEYCQHDLGKLLDTMKKRFSLPEVLKYLYFGNIYIFMDRLNDCCINY